MTWTVTLPALAKVNLFLRVLARQEDGFHSLETLLCLVSLAESLSKSRGAMPAPRNKTWP
jgi:4-diphosphocytidyl-2C-methyl-D-erythritol kinase